jgi:Trk-type K+ transport system membrane component
VSKSDSAASKRERNKTIRWVVTIFIVTIFISGTISLLSDIIMENSSMVVAFLILLTIILMFIGAGSGSTGGGVKMTTFAVLVLNIAAYVRRRPSVNVFDRRIDDATIHKAASSAGMFLAAGLAGCMVLCVQGVPLTAALFESVSAIGTAGLSLGITSSLPVISKVTVMLMMFAGRLGSLSVAMALTRNIPSTITTTSSKLNNRFFIYFPPKYFAF